MNEAVKIPASPPAVAPASKPKTMKKTLTATLRTWHQKVGLGAAVFVIWLAISGTLLSRSNELGFDTTRLRWSWLASMYGLHAESPRMGFTVAENWLASTKEATLLNAEELAPRVQTPLGIVAGGDQKSPLLFIATSDSVVVVKPDGSRVDELRSPVLPISSVRRIGNSAAGGIAVQDYDAYESLDSGTTWSPVAAATVTWSEPSPLPAEQREKIASFAKPSILLEQFLIDLHTGRLFGAIGSWVITLVGFMALWLAVSGFWTWYRINASRRKQGR